MSRSSNENNRLNTSILKHLKQNGRSSFAEIAKDIGLSIGSVSKRVDALVQKGIIRKFSVELHSCCWILLKLKDCDDVAHREIVVRAISEFSKNTTCVDRVSAISGSFDYLVVLSPTDEEEVFEFISQLTQTGLIATHLRAGLMKDLQIPLA